MGRGRREVTPPDDPHLPERVVGLVKRTVREGALSKGAKLLFDHAPLSVERQRSH